MLTFNNLQPREKKAVLVIETIEKEVHEPLKKTAFKRYLFDKKINHEGKFVYTVFDIYSQREILNMVSRVMNDQKAINYVTRCYGLIDVIRAFEPILD